MIDMIGIYMVLNINFNAVNSILIVLSETNLFVIQIKIMNCSN